MTVTFPEPDEPEKINILLGHCTTGKGPMYSLLIGPKTTPVGELVRDANGIPRRYSAAFLNGCPSAKDDPPQNVGPDASDVLGFLLSTWSALNPTAVRGPGAERCPWKDTAAGHRRVGRATPYEGIQAYRVIPASKATLFADDVFEQEEMGQALRLLREEAGLTIDQLTARVAGLNIPGTGRATVARVFAGGSLCATREALVTLVEACGVVGEDVNVWVSAWERARASQRPRGRKPASVKTELTELAEVSADMVKSTELTVVDSPASVHSDRETDPDEENQDGPDTILNGADDEVLGSWTVTFTRGHVRSAIVMSALLGLTATTSSGPAVRKAGAVVLGIAATLALFETIHNAAGSTSGQARESAVA